MTFKQKLFCFFINHHWVMTPQDKFGIIHKIQCSMCNKLLDDKIWHMTKKGIWEDFNK